MRVLQNIADLVVAIARRALLLTSYLFHGWYTRRRFSPSNDVHGGSPDGRSVSDENVRVGTWQKGPRALRFALLVTLSLPCLPNVQAQTYPPYKMFDSGFAAEDARPTFWIDDERVVFTGVVVGSKCEHPNPECGWRGGLVNRTYIWNTTKNEVTVYRPTTLHELCVQGGYISYKLAVRPGESQPDTFAGPFGKERKLPSGVKLWFNPISCRYYDKPPAWAAARERGREIAPLLERHGYIDFGIWDPLQRTKEEVADPRPQWKRPDGSVARISFAKYLKGQPFISYIGFADEYHVWGTGIDTSQVQPAVFMRPDGTLYQIDFNIPRRIGGAYTPTRVGMFMNTAGDRKIDSAGGYLIKPDHLVPIAKGDLRRASVSPDGCRVAFVYAYEGRLSAGYQEWRHGRPGNTLRYINLCAGGGP